MQWERYWVSHYLVPNNLMHKVKLLLTSLLLIFSIVSLSSVVATGEFLIDYDCVNYKLLNPGDSNVCNDLCRKDCIDAGQSCPPGESDPASCIDLPGEIVPDDFTKNINFFGIYFGAPDQALGRLLRVFFMGVFAMLAMFSILYGIYGLWVRSTAGDSSDKVEEGDKIFKSAFWGIVVSFSAVLIMQIAAVILGIEGNIFKINLIPKQGFGLVEITTDDLDGACLPEQTGDLDKDGSADYKCEEGKWVHI